MQSVHRACTSRAFSSSGRMFSGAIASLTSGKASGPRSGLGLALAPVHGCGGAERTEPVAFFLLPRDGGRRGLGLGADCRCLLRVAAREDAPRLSLPRPAASSLFNPTGAGSGNASARARGS